MLVWQVEKLFVVVKGTSIFVGRERNVTITRVLVDKKCRLETGRLVLVSTLILAEVKMASRK